MTSRPSSPMRDGVGPDVALQVHASEPGHVPEQGQVEPHHVGQVLGVGPERVEVVAR